MSRAFDDLAADLELSQRLAAAADAISLPRFGAADLHVDAKPDLSPVTDADLAVERAIRDVLGPNGRTTPCWGRSSAAPPPGRSGSG